MSAIVETVSEMLNNVEAEIGREKEYCLENYLDDSKEWTEMDRKFIKELVDKIYSDRFGYLTEDICEIRESFEKDVTRLDMDMMLYFKHKARAFERELHRTHYRVMVRFDPEAFNEIDMNELDYDEVYMYEEIAEEKEMITCEVEGKEEYKGIDDDVKYYAYNIYCKYVDRLWGMMRGNEMILRGIVYKKC